jgi:hypothetical protein
MTPTMQVEIIAKEDEMQKSTPLFFILVDFLRLKHLVLWIFETLVSSKIRNGGFHHVVLQLRNWCAYSTLNDIPFTRINSTNA